MDLRKGRWPGFYFPLSCLGIVLLFSCTNSNSSDSRSNAEPATGQLSNNSKSLTVTVSPSADIEIWYQTPGITAYNFGNDVGTNDTSITVASITVKNASAGIREAWSIRASNAHTATSPNDWTLSDTVSAGTKNYELRAVLNTAKPADAAFIDTEDELENGNQAMTDAVFDGDEDGLTVNSGETRGLWFRINTPMQVIDTTAHTIYVTLVATPG